MSIWSCSTHELGPVHSTSDEEMPLLIPKEFDPATQRVSGVFLKCLEVQKGSVVVHAPQAEHGPLIKSFLEELQKPENSLPEIVSAFGQVKRLCSSDIFFRPFLKDIDMLLRRFEGRPQEARLVLIPLLSKVFSQRMTPGKGHRLAAELLYLVDKNIWGDDFDKVDIGRDSPNCIGFECLKLSCQIMKKYQEIKVFDDKSLLRRLFPLSLATLLFLKDSSFNSGILEHLSEIYSFYPEYPETGKAYISSVLQEIESDERFGLFFEQIAAPQKGSRGQELVNIILERPLDQECTIADTKIALLTSCLTWWRQGEIGNCFIFARHTAIREARPLEYIKELYELLSKGFVIRMLHGREVHLYGLPVVQLQACDHSFCPQHIFEAPLVGVALRLLGGAEKDVHDICASIKEPSLHELLEKIASIHGASQKMLFKAYSLIGAATQDVLGYAWQNAVASEAIMQWPVLQEYQLALGRKNVSVTDTIGFTVIPIAEEDKGEYCSMVPYIEREGKPELFEQEEDFFRYIHKFEPESLNPEDSGNRFLHFLRHKLTNLSCKCLLSQFDQKEVLGITSKRGFVQIHLPPHVPALQKLIPFTTFQVPNEFCLTKWLSEFFKQKETLEDLHGLDPSISALALAPGDAHESGCAHGVGHVFRYLFSDPSIAEIKNLECLLFKKEQMLQALKKQRFTLEVAQSKLCQKKGLLFEETVTHSLEGLSAHELYSVQEILGRVSDSLMNWDKSPFFHDLDKAKVSLDCIFMLMSLLVHEEPDFEKPFIHFADMNWEAENSAKHAALWLDPISTDWKIVYVTEDNIPLYVVPLDEVKNYFYFSCIADVCTNDSLYPKGYKQALAFKWKTAKKLQKIEQTFLDAWKGLKDYLHKKDVSQEILDCQTSSFFSVQESPFEKLKQLHELAENPDNWQQPFEVCLKLIALYKTILNQAPEEFHTRAFKPVGFLKILESQ
jgi:hypothetical protein